MHHLSFVGLAIGGSRREASFDTNVKSGRSRGRVVEENACDQPVRSLTGFDRRGEDRQRRAPQRNAHLPICNGRADHHDDRSTDRCNFDAIHLITTERSPCAVGLLPERLAFRVLE